MLGLDFIIYERICFISAGVVGNSEVVEECTNLTNAYFCKRISRGSVTSQHLVNAFASIQDISEYITR